MDEDDENEEDDHNEEANQLQLNNLAIGQDVLIKIKSIQYEQNNLFLIASFVKILQ